MKGEVGGVEWALTIWKQKISEDVHGNEKKKPPQIFTDVDSKKKLCTWMVSRVVVVVGVLVVVFAFVCGFALCPVVPFVVV